MEQLLCKRTALRRRLFILIEKFSDGLDSHITAIHQKLRNLRAVIVEHQLHIRCNPGNAAAAG